MATIAGCRGGEVDGPWFISRRWAILDTRCSLWNCANWQLASMVQQKHVLAIASGGGHWQQLMRLCPAFEGQRVTFVTTDAAYAADVGGQELLIVSDANRDHPLKLIRLAYQVLVRILRTRPDVVHLDRRGTRRIWCHLRPSGGSENRLDRQYRQRRTPLSLRPHRFEDCAHRADAVATPGRAQRATLPRSHPVIFVTVGGQLPFDRLVHAVDEWAKDRRREDVFAQIGDSSNAPDYIQWENFVSPSEFRAKAEESDVIVAHAGMGSILTALELGKPIVVMPRRAHLGEHRNDHQWATANHLGQGLGIPVAADEAELIGLLDHLDGPSKPDRTTKRGIHGVARFSARSDSTARNEDAAGR